MSEDLKVKPTPIQRNSLDVAMELTEMYYVSHNQGDLEEMQNTFAKFYSSVQVAQNLKITGVLDLVPKELSEAYKKDR